MSDLTLTIENEKIVYYPLVEEEITLDISRSGAPSKLSFNVIKDETLNFQEGNLVKLAHKDKLIFVGFVFSKKRDKDQIIKVTAYDQLRYLKNKDTYVYENKKASDLLKMIATDYKLRVGEIDDTEHIIESRIEDNKTLFDIMKNALDETIKNKHKMYILYDEAGRIFLKDKDKMGLDIVIDQTCIENFDYTSSIDGETYNSIKLISENEKASKRGYCTVEDKENVEKWGRLQYFEVIKDNSKKQSKAEGLLKLYNRKTRNLKVKNAIGDIRVRAGSRLIVDLNIGDIEVKKNMLVEDVKHTFKDNEHRMDLTLIGGDLFNA